MISLRQFAARSLGRLLLSCALLGFCPAIAAATTYTVSSTSDGEGVCFATTCPTLRSAVEAANGNPGSTIQLQAGTYTLGNGAGNPIGTGELQISAPMTITGAGAASTIVKQTDGRDRVLNIWNSVSLVTINDLTLTGGVLPPGASEPGAGIYTVAPLTLNGVDVSGNSETGSDTLPTSNGCCQAVGGITSLDRLILNNSKVDHNTATASAGAAGS